MLTVGVWTRTDMLLAALISLGRKDSDVKQWSETKLGFSLSVFFSWMVNLSTSGSFVVQPKQLLTSCSVAGSVSKIAIVRRVRTRLCSVIRARQVILCLELWSIYLGLGFMQGKKPYAKTIKVFVPSLTLSINDEKCNSETHQLIEYKINTENGR